MSFPEMIKAYNVQQGSLALIWLGQAGFLIKTHGGKVIVIDPYLSDFVHESLKDEYGDGFKRMAAPLFEPEDVDIDILLASHEHGDHLDLHALPGIMKNPKTICYTNADSYKLIAEQGIDTERVKTIKVNDSLDMGEFQLHALPCDHGELAPGAMGFLLDFGFTKIYYSGDTAYNLPVLQAAIDAKPTVALLPINGMFGNLGSEEAAKLSADLGASICVPHHFWTFPFHGGDPMAAIESFKVFAPECRLLLTTPGKPEII